MKKREQAILFDLDGTLWDSTEAAAKIWSDVTAGYPQIKESITAEKLKSLYGLPLEEIAKQLFRSVEESLALKVMEECVRVQCPILAKGGGRLMGDVAAVFETLRNDYQIMIVSNCRSGYIEAFLEAHQLGGLVDDFTCPGETGRLKADNIRLICERNHLDLKNVIYVGDTVSDEQAAHEAGVPFVYAAYGFGESKQYEYRLEDLSELLHMRIEQRGKRKKMKIVFLEADTLGKDMDFSKYESLGEVIRYEKSEPAKNAERIREADIVIANKVPMNEELLKDCDKLKLICLTATGVNNIDFDYVNRIGIKVANVRGYSTDSVAQHTFALLFYLYEKLHFYDSYVKSGEYVMCDIFSKFDVHFHELAGKRWGIIGLGEIGRKVAAIATLFGCEVIYYSTTGIHDDPEYKRVDKETLFQTSDIISIHAPLNEATLDLVGEEELGRMKKEAILLNLGRGPIVNQEALAKALKEEWIGGAGLDVLTVEPMAADNPLLEIKDSTRLIITPHIAWATVEARQRCVDEVRRNIEAFLAGEERNICR